MTPRPTPQQDDCRTYARKYSKTKVILIAINDRDGSFELVTYGENAKTSDRAKELGAVAYAAIIKYLGGQ